MTMAASVLRPVAARRRVLLLGLVVAVISGLVWMHSLTASHRSGADRAAGHAASAAAADPCADRHPDPHCPVRPPKHPGPVCQSGAVPGAFTALPAAGAPAARAPVHVTLARPLSAMTAAADSGGGSGCGPPSLIMLSISRT